MSAAGFAVAQTDTPPPGPPPSGVDASELSTYVPGLTPKEAAALSADGMIESDYSGAIDTRLAPTFSGHDAMVQDLKQTDANVGIELLFQTRVPAALSGQSSLFLKMFNVMRSVSTLKGIEYYSADRHRMRTFYYDAYAIASPDKTGTPIPDPTVPSLPANSHIYTYHKDSSFGNYVMEVSYEVGPSTDNPDYIRMTLTNVTTMFYTIVPIAQPRHLQLDMVVVPKGNTLLFYSNFIANAPNIFGLRDQIDISFKNRIVALFDWFVKQLDDSAR